MFDKQVHYEGKENTYEFRKYGQWYKLTPMMESVVEATTNCGGTNMSNNHIMLCSAKEFLKEEKREELYLVLKVVKEKVKL